MAWNIAFTNRPDLLGYTYDTSGNPVTATQSGSMTYLDADRTYAYDTANRLITSRYTDTQGWESSPSTVTSWYSYDDLGNRLSHSHRGAGSITYAHDKANRMTTLAGLAQGYDLAGNQTRAYSTDRGTSYLYKYDHHNRLTSVRDSGDSASEASFTWDALGRRIQFIHHDRNQTVRYYYDGVNEIVEDNQSAARQRYYIHGVSYVDERLMMYADSTARPYYFTWDRMYNVYAIVDRAGAIVERTMYDGYGRPYLRESCGRGDMNSDTVMTSTDTARFDLARAGSIFDPRADIDDDGDVDSTDQTLYDNKKASWDPLEELPGLVAQPFSDVGNPYQFQGVPHFALDSGAFGLSAKLLLNHHRARFADPVIGRWGSRDPKYYNKALQSQVPLVLMISLIPSAKTLRETSGILASNPIYYGDPLGLDAAPIGCAGIIVSGDTGSKGIPDPDHPGGTFHGSLWVLGCPSPDDVVVQRIEIQMHDVSCPPAGKDPVERSEQHCFIEVFDSSMEGGQAGDKNGLTFFGNSTTPTIDAGMTMDIEAYCVDRNYLSVLGLSAPPPTPPPGIFNMAPNTHKCDSISGLEGPHSVRHTGVWWRNCCGKKKGPVTTSRIDSNCP